MIALTIDGVLRQPVGGAPIPSGILLYRALVEKTSVGLIAAEKREDVVRHWLLVNDLTEHDYLVLPKDTDADDPGQQRVEQLLRLGTSGHVDLLIESDPARAEAVIREGTPVMLYAHPAYSRPEHLPGERRLPTPWSSLMHEIERQQTIKASDGRLTQDTL